VAYGRIYIENLRKKVTAIFDELKEENRLCEDNFIELFKRKYPKDYSTLEYEWEFKVHEFKKNRKGNPKPHPIRPDKILSNMYRNYYFKLVKNPSIRKSKEKAVNQIRTLAGKHGYRIKKNENNRYDVVVKETKEIEFANLTYGELKEKFSSQNINEMKQRIADRKEEKSDG
jgi:hypothetical protein